MDCLEVVFFGFPCPPLDFTFLVALDLLPVFRTNWVSAGAGALLAAKRDLVLPGQVRRLDNLDLLPLDDLGCLPRRLKGRK